MSPVMRSFQRKNNSITRHSTGPIKRSEEPHKISVVKSAMLRALFINEGLIGIAHPSMGLISKIILPELIDERLFSHA